MTKCRFYVIAIALILGGHSANALAQNIPEQCSDRSAYSAQERIAACNNLLTHSSNDFTRRVAALYNLGIAQYDNKDLSSSIQSFSAAIRTDPAYVPAYVNRGIAERAAGQYDLAIQDYTHAISLDPSDGRAFENRANIYVLRKDYTQALDDYSRAIKLDPTNARSRINRATVYDLMGRGEQSLSDYSEAGRIDPKSADALNGQCFVLAKQRHLVPALADCNAALAINSRDPNIWDSKGLVELLAGKYRDAQLSYSNALQFDPTLATALYGRGIAKLKLRNTSGYNDINSARHISPSVDAEMAARGVLLK